MGLSLTTGTEQERLASTTSKNVLYCYAKAAGLVMLTLPLSLPPFSLPLSPSLPFSLSQSAPLFLPLLSASLRWYCHFDDDLYVNPQALTDLLSQHDPTTDQYLGAWAVVGRVHRQNRIPVSSSMKMPHLLFEYFNINFM